MDDAHPGSVGEVLGATKTPNRNAVSSRSPGLRKLPWGRAGPETRFQPQRGCVIVASDRTHVRDPKNDVIEEYVDESDGSTQQRVIERAPKDVIADEGFSINRMCILLYQAVQELAAKVEALEAQVGVPKA